MHTGQYGAPRPAAREEIKVSTLHRNWHRRFKLRLRDGETFHFVVISEILNSLNADLLIYGFSQFVYSCGNSKFITFQHTNTRYELKKKEARKGLLKQQTLSNLKPVVLLKETSGFQYLKDQYRDNRECVSRASKLSVNAIRLFITGKEIQF